MYQGKRNEEGEGSRSNKNRWKVKNSGILWNKGRRTDCRSIGGE